MTEHIKRNIILLCIFLLLLTQHENLMQLMVSLIKWKNDYLSINNDNIYYPRIILVGVAILAIISFVAKFEKLAYVGMTILMLGYLTYSLVALLSYQAATEQTIIESRLFEKTEISWEQVEHITTGVELKRKFFDSGKRYGRNSTSSNAKTPFFQFRAETATASINLWEDEQSAKQLYDLAKVQQIPIKHEPLHETIVNNPEYFFNGYSVEMKEVFGF